MKNRLLPQNIAAHPFGLIVAVERRGTVYRGWVPRTHLNPLERAIELRKELLNAAGPVKRPKTLRPRRIARSNTGVVGVSETMKWVRHRSYPCFNVCWSEKGHGRLKRFIFGRGVRRETAFRKAVAHRQKMMRGK